MSVINSEKDMIINQLLKNDDNSLKLLICASQAIPRVFLVILCSCISKRIELQEDIINANIIYECTINYFTDILRKKMPYQLKIVDAVENLPKRLFIMKLPDYHKAQRYIDGMVANGFIHQYPSKTIPKKYRNKYKAFLVHYGSYLESLKEKGFKKFRGNEFNLDTSIYPPLTKNILKLLVVLYFEYN